MDTSSAKQDEVDIGRDEADEVGGTEPRPRGFPPLTEAARHPAAELQQKQQWAELGCSESRQGRRQQACDGSCNERRRGGGE